MKINKIENKEIQVSLIKSYEIMEEKLNQNNETIKELETELSGGEYQKKKGKKEKRTTIGSGRNQFFVLNE